MFLQCAGRWVQCNFIVHTALERTGRRRRRDRTVNGPQHAVSQTFQTVFSAFLCFFLWSRCIFFACHGSYIEGQLHIGVSTFSSILGWVKHLMWRACRFMCELGALKCWCFKIQHSYKFSKSPNIWPCVRDRILFSGSLRLARLFPRNVIEYHVRIFQLKVLSILKCCDYMSIWFP